MHLYLLGRGVTCFKKSTLLRYNLHTTKKVHFQDCFNEFPQIYTSASTTTVKTGNISTTLEGSLGSSPVSLCPSLLHATLMAFLSLYISCFPLDPCHGVTQGVLLWGACCSPSLPWAPWHPGCPGPGGAGVSLPSPAFSDISLVAGRRPEGGQHLLHRNWQACPSGLLLSWEPADKHLRVHHRPVCSQSYFLITVRPRWQETQHLRCSRLLALLPPQSPKNPEGLSLRACPARRGTAEGGVGPLRRPLAGAGGGRFPLSQLPRLGEQASWRGASAPLLC